jgi:hypothetical protein
MHAKPLPLLGLDSRRTGLCQYVVLPPRTAITRLPAARDEAFAFKFVEDGIHRARGYLEVAVGQ